MVRVAHGGFSGSDARWMPHPAYDHGDLVTKLPAFGFGSVIDARTWVLSRAIASGAIVSVAKNPRQIVV